MDASSIPLVVTTEMSLDIAKFPRTTKKIFRTGKMSKIMVFNILILSTGKMRPTEINLLLLFFFFAKYNTPGSQA